MNRLGLRSKKGKNIQKSTIENILKDSFYYGVSYSKKYKVSANHNYARLITKELFDRCQEIRKGKSGRPEKSIVREDFIFGGLMKCNKCGCTVTPEKKSKKSGKEFIYYSCTNGKHICKREYISENNLLEPIYSILYKFSTITPETQNFILTEMRKSEESEVSFNKAQIIKIDKEMEKIGTSDENLLKTYCNPSSSITSEMYDKIHQEYQDQLTNLSYQKDTYSKGKSEYELSIVTVFSLAMRAKEIFESSEVGEKKLLLKFLLQNPTLDNKKPIFNLESPFDVLLTESLIKQKSQIGSEISDISFNWLPE
ncbi:MAG: recombinase family protein [Candidatus Gracilibacteria bacterium]|nr:recombinase family protein [Candidatus Gracilibacteria bacterium]